MNDPNDPYADDLSDLDDQSVIDRGDADDLSVIELDNPDDISVIDFPEVCYNSRGMKMPHGTKLRGSSTIRSMVPRGSPRVPWGFRL